MSDDAWQSVYWEENYKKHHPLSERVPWRDVVKGTNERRMIARYRTGMTPQEIRELEMVVSLIETTDDNSELDSDEQEAHFICERGTERFYYRVCPDMIGASRGEETNIIKIRRHQAGGVHGLTCFAFFGQLNILFWRALEEPSDVAEEV